MKTRGLARWLAEVAGGLLLVVPGLGWAGWGVGGIPRALEQCEDELQACLELPCIIFPGDGWPEDAYPSGGAPLSYSEPVPADGTFTDDNTGLMWEIKTGTVGDPVNCAVDPMPSVCIDVSDVNNRYDWTDPNDGNATDPDGLVFEFFLPMLNQTCGGEGWDLGCESDADCASAAITYCGLAGHTDWRLPTAKELQSLVDYSTYDPAASFPGEVASDYYWSSSSFADYQSFAWNVGFFYGNGNVNSKSDDFHVRAVRGGR